MKLLLYFGFALLARSALFAATFAGGTTFVAPFSTSESVACAGETSMKISEQGVFSASQWVFAGGLVLENPGVYIFNGPVYITGGVRGPSTGNAIIRFAGEHVITGTISPNVSITSNGQPSASAAPPLINISTRTTLNAGQVVNPGFVVGGDTPRTVLIRAVGPGLRAFGVVDVLAAPVLTVFSGARVVAENSGWGGEATIASVSSSVGAFPLQASSRDAALLLRLAPGAYTARVDGGAGELLLELYHVD